MGGLTPLQDMCTYALLFDALFNYKTFYKYIDKIKYALTLLKLILIEKLLSHLPYFKINMIKMWDEKYPSWKQRCP